MPAETPHRLPAMDPGNVQAQLLAQLHSGVKDRQASDGSVQIQLVSRRPALEATVHVPLQVGGEAAAARRPRTMHRTRAAYLVPGAWRGMKPTRSRTAAIGISARTAGKQMPGIAKPVADGGSGGSAYHDRNPSNREEEPVLTARRGANMLPSTAGCCSWSSPKGLMESRCPRATQLLVSVESKRHRPVFTPYVSLLQPDFRKKLEKPIGAGQGPLPALRAWPGHPAKVAPC